MVCKVRELNNDKVKFDHLIKNLERIREKDTILNHEFCKNDILSLGKGNLNDWLEQLLPNTRLIIEPKINGIGLAIYYENGELKKIINKHNTDLTKQTEINSVIPNQICITQKIEILGQFYIPKIGLSEDRYENYNIKNNISFNIEKRFCAFQILNCKLNHFQSIRELEKLNFEIPESESTNDITDVHLFHRYWKEGIIFKRYPTSGIVLKINSKKLQKHLIENNVSINWGYRI